MVLAKANATIGRKALRLADRELLAPLRRASGRVRAAIRDGLALDPGARMLAAARNLRAAVKDNLYTHTPTIQPEKGIFHGDCSDFIGYLLGKVNPKALKALPVDAGRLEPRSRNFYAHLKDLPVARAGGQKQSWAKVRRPADLRAGDIVAWKNEAYKPGVGSTGHVMLVAEAPRPVHKNGHLAGFDVPVIDSTSHGHGVADLRAKGGQTGLGEGVVFFPVDKKGAATGFSWEPSADPAASPLRPPVLAFGRLLG